MSKQYDMRGNGWVESSAGHYPQWRKGEYLIEVWAKGADLVHCPSENEIASMAHDSIDPVGSLARIADEREGRAKEPVSLNEERERKARELKKTSEERCAAALESIAASLEKMAARPSGIPMTPEDARVWLGMKKPEHPVNIAPEDAPPIFRKPGEPAPEMMTTADALAWAKEVENDWKAGKPNA